MLAGDIVNFAGCSVFFFFFFEMVANAKADTCALVLRMFTFEFLIQLLLDRFVDISVDVRVECVKRAKEFLKYHPDLVTDVTGDCFWLICYLLNNFVNNLFLILLSGDKLERDNLFYLLFTFSIWICE